MANFYVQGSVYQLTSNSIRKSALLQSLTDPRLGIPRTDDGAIVVTNVTASDFEIVFRFLEHEELPPIDKLPLLEYFDISSYSNYKLSLLQEKYLRDNMYSPKFAKHAINTDPHYNLVEITEELWDHLELKSPSTDPEIMKLSKATLQKQSWSEIQRKLQMLQPYLTGDSGSLLVAGGYVFSALFGTKAFDIDLFLWGCQLDDTEKCVVELRDRLLQNFDALQVYRSQHSLGLTVEHTSTKKDMYQLILRLYRSPSEVLHGFDVDCCSLGYDGKRIWATPRALFALTSGYNTVNFDRLSPTYEIRLAKYSVRGVAIRIPGFDQARVSIKDLMERQSNYRAYRLKLDGKNKSKEIEELISLEGLDVLLYASYCIQQNPGLKTSSLKAIVRATKLKSDYSPSSVAGSDISGYISYLLSSSENYPEISSKYNPELKAIPTDVLKTLESIHINNMLRSHKIYFVSGKLDTRKWALTEDNDNVWDQLIEIDPYLYAGLGAVRAWDLPRKLEFKTRNPGEQATGTFHQTVLADNSKWYAGQFYRLD